MEEVMSTRKEAAEKLVDLRRYGMLGEEYNISLDMAIDALLDEDIKEAEGFLKEATLLHDFAEMLVNILEDKVEKREITEAVSKYLDDAHDLLEKFKKTYTKPVEERRTDV